MIILGIESSCDDTSVALVKCTEQDFEVLNEKTASQIDIHKKYGGVVPEIAARRHSENILPIIEEVLFNQPKPEVIAVTAGPGLVTGLLVGVTAAKTLGYLWNIPVIPINHIEGHIYSSLISNFSNSFQFPALALIVSGGHTEIIEIKKEGKYKILGKTLDDAAGECFDKVAKLLKFDYPGGPKISEASKTGKIDAIKFPRPMLNDKNFNFSFSGLKTSALYWLRDNKLNKKITINDFCASFEQAIIDVLVSKTIKAVKKYNPKTVILGGGVSANKKLRERLEKELKLNISCPLFLSPSTKYCMDNATMIAVACYHYTKNKKIKSWKKITVDPNWKIA